MENLSLGTHISCAQEAAMSAQAVEGSDIKKGDPVQVQLDLSPKHVKQASHTSMDKQHVRKLTFIPEELNEGFAGNGSRR